MTSSEFFAENPAPQSPLSKAPKTSDMQPPSRRVLIIAGDVSGEQHGAKVATALKARYPELILEGVGGQAMAAAGVHLLADQAKMGKVGVGSLTGAPYHWWLGQKLLAHTKHHPPDVVLHIDYGVFNLWLAKQFRKQGIPTVDYIPPQVWASRPGRIKKIKASFDHVCCIFPFEQALYEKHEIPVTYVGHPLAGQLPSPIAKSEFCNTHNLDPNQPLLAVFPGSRKSEIGFLLKDMVAAVAQLNQQRVVKHLPPVQPVLAQGEHFPKAWFDDQFTQACKAASIDPSTWHRLPGNDRYSLLAAADAAIVKSGTTTLEAALYETPMVIVYKLQPLVAAIGFKIAMLPVLGLPNILTDPYNPPVPELLQNNCTPEKMATTLQQLLENNSPVLTKQHKAFTHIRNAIPTNDAAENVANVLSRYVGE